MYIFRDNDDNEIKKQHSSFCYYLLAFYVYSFKSHEMIGYGMVWCGMVRAEIKID